MENESTKKTNLFNRAAKGLFWLGSAYILPTSYKKIFAAIALSACIIPMARLFPTAEDILKAEGVDPAVLTTLTDRDVYITDRSLKSHLYFIFKNTIIISQIDNFIKFDKKCQDSGNAFATKRSNLDALSLFEKKPYYLVIPPRKGNLTAKQIIADKTRIPLAYIEHTGASTQDLYLQLLLHEFRHSSSDNEILPKLEKEADAEYHAIITFVDILSRNPEIKKVAINNFIIMQFLRSDPLDFSHDIALYLDARLKEQEPPEASAIIAATKEAYKKMTAQLIESDERERFIRYTEAFREILNEDNTLSPLARRTAELFVEAVEYHAPSAVGGKTLVQTTYNAPAITNQQTHAFQPPRPDA